MATACYGSTFDSHNSPQITYDFFVIYGASRRTRRLIPLSSTAMHIVKHEPARVAASYGGSGSSPASCASTSLCRLAKCGNAWTLTYAS